MDTTITLPAGGKLHASRSHLCLAFEKTRFSLSTAIYGGGFKEINYAVNQKLETFYPSEDRFPGGSVPEFLRLSILENGYDPAKACALLTAAKMEWRSVKTFSHKELLLDAVTTGGAEKTAARAGSPPLYTEKDGHFFPVGTINIMISLNISLPSAIMTRAIITITEGKTAALQDLGIADVNNGLPATERERTASRSSPIRMPRVIRTQALSPSSVRFSLPQRMKQSANVWSSMTSHGTGMILSLRRPPSICPA